MEIYFSKSKIIKLLIVSILIVAFCIYLELFPETIKIKNWDIEFKKLIGVIAIVIGTGGIIINSKKLTKKSPGFIISDKGIIDNSSNINIGLIPWKEITEIELITVRGYKFIVIHVEDNDNLINGNLLKKALLSFYKFYYQSPIVISTNTLEINIEKLQLILLENFKLHKVPNS